MADDETAGNPGRFPDPVAAIAVCASVALLLYKMWLASVLNINWDEFFYLSNLHEHLRGGSTSVLQRGYVYMFAWLPAVSSDEVTQINAARIVMVALLGLTCWLVWAVARELGLPGRPAALAVLTYLVAVPVIRHGGSFRADSLLAPLVMLGFLLLTRRGPWVGATAAAGFVLGVAAFVSVKTALFVPAFVALAALHPGTGCAAGRVQGPRFRAIASVAAAAAVTFGVLVGMHSLGIEGTEVKSAATVASSAVEKTVFTANWAPRGDMLLRYVNWQPLLWMLIAIGTISAIWLRRFRLAALALCLTPVVYYRNAFPYFYVVMLAPVSVLAGLAIEQVEIVVKRYSAARIAGLLSAIIALGLVYQCWRFASNVRHMHQFQQRAIVAAVHQIFPMPVSYIDRCGMIASLRKVSPFMSTWGLEAYAAARVPFMPQALAKRAAFVLANHPALERHRAASGPLLPIDGQLLEQFYLPYWGPVRVAGGRAVLEGDAQSIIQVPFPAQYRLESGGARIDIDGKTHEDGAVLEIRGNAVVARISSASPSSSVIVALYLAAARPPPGAPYDGYPIFAGL